MGIFGHQYPPELRLVIQHAERFAGLLSSLDVGSLPDDAFARAWLVGRTEEMEAVIGNIVADWRDGTVSVDSAANAITFYVRALHQGAREHLGLPPIPDCCLGDVAVTVPMTPFDAVTTPVAPPKASHTDTLVERTGIGPRKPGEDD